MLGIEAVVATAIQADARQADIAELRRLKTEVWPGLYRDLDRDGLDRFLRDDFVIIDDEGNIRTKKDELAWMGQAQVSTQPEDFAYRVEDILFAGPEVALVFGEGTSTRTTEDGVPCAHSYWSSNTLVLEVGAWRPILSHVSAVRCDPIGE